MSSAGSSSSSSSPSDSSNNGGRKKKQGLGWLEWGRGWLAVVGEFLFQRIAASNLENPMELPPLDGITFVVTGATSGIGAQIARQLAEAGGHVVMAVRTMSKAHDLILKWQSEKEGLGRPLNVEVMEIDLLSLDSVVRFAEAWNARLGPLHVLINNAGIFAIGAPQRFSKDGYEQHLQVNHLAPALLSLLLLPSLVRGSPCRIVNVNSIMHYVGFADSEDLNFTSGKRKYSSYAGYSSSKLAQVKFSSILYKRLPGEAGINTVCVSPGIVQTSVTRDLPKTVIAAYQLLPYFVFDAQEGCRSALFAATDPQIPEYCATLKAEEWPVCAYISPDCRPTNPSEEAYNLQTSQEIWTKTLEMIGLPRDALEKLIQGEEIQCRYGHDRNQ